VAYFEGADGHRTFMLPKSDYVPNKEALDRFFSDLIPRQYEKKIESQPKLQMPNISHSVQLKNNSIEVENQTVHQMN